MAEQQYSLDSILLTLIGISFLLQLYTIYLILEKSTAEMRVYRFYLCGMAIPDMIFGITLGFLMKPEMWIPDSGEVEMTGLARFLGWEGGRISYSLFVTSFCSQLIFQMFSMLFRYSQVMSMEHPKLSKIIDKTSTRFCILIFVCIISAVIGYFTFSFSYPILEIIIWQFNGRNYTLLNANLPQNRSEQTEEFLNGDNMRGLLEQIGPYTPRVGEQYNIYALTAEQVRERILYSIRGIENDMTGYKKEHKRILEAIKLGHPMLFLELRRRIGMVVLECYFGTLVIVQCFCFYSGISVIHYLRRNRHRFSAQTYKLQMQLTILLIIQMIQPLFYIALPFAYWLIYLFDIDMDNPMTFLSNCIYFEIAIIWLSTYSVVNPLLTLTFVRPYRDYTRNKFLLFIRLILRLWRWLRNKQNTSAVAPVPTPSLLPSSNIIEN